MFLLSRIRDAAKAAGRVLVGRSESQLEVLRIKREWQGTELEINVMFDNVNALIARLSKRQKREKVAADTPPEAPPESLELPLEPVPVNGKAAIRQRIRRGQRLSHTTPRQPEE